jgi:hypothetical protein
MCAALPHAPAPSPQTAGRWACFAAIGTTKGRLRRCFTRRRRPRASQRSPSCSRPRCPPPATSARRRGFGRSWEHAFFCFSVRWQRAATCFFCFIALICYAVSLCGGPVFIRLYRKRKTARLMHSSVALQAPSEQRPSDQAPSEQRPSDQQPKAEAAAAPGEWAAASSVESFCNTSYAAGGPGAAACQRSRRLYLLCRGGCPGHASAWGR